MSLRKMMSDKIIDYLLDSGFYGDYLSACEEPEIAHRRVVDTLNKVSDAMLLSIFTKLLSGRELVPYGSEHDGDFIHVKIGRYYGGMYSDGSIHT